jgi:hypothetical protein
MTYISTDNLVVLISRCEASIGSKFGNETIATKVPKSINNEYKVGLFLSVFIKSKIVSLFKINLPITKFKRHLLIFKSKKLINNKLELKMYWNHIRRYYFVVHTILSGIIRCEYFSNNNLNILDTKLLIENKIKSR